MPRSGVLTGGKSARYDSDCPRALANVPSRWRSHAGMLIERQELGTLSRIESTLLAALVRDDMCAAAGVCGGLGCVAGWWRLGAAAAGRCRRRRLELCLTPSDWHVAALVGLWRRLLLFIRVVDLVIRWLTN